MPERIVDNSRTSRGGPEKSGFVRSQDMSQCRNILSNGLNYEEPGVC